MKYPDKFSFTNSVSYSVTAYKHNYTWRCSGSFTEFTEEDIDSHFNRGIWTDFKDLTIPEEPEMKFPFKIQWTTTKDKTLYTVEKNNVAHGVKVIWNEGADVAYYTEENLVGLIKEGIVIVVEPPPEASEQVSKLPIQVDATEALGAVKELTKALEELEVVYNRVKNLIGSV